MAAHAAAVVQPVNERVLAGDPAAALGGGGELRASRGREERAEGLIGGAKTSKGKYTAIKPYLGDNSSL